MESPDTPLSQNECSPPPGHREKVEAMFPIYEKSDSPTAEIKRGFQRIAYRLLQIQDATTSQAAKRSVSLALTEIETASMYAVKAVHQG